MAVACRKTEISAAGNSGPRDRGARWYVVRVKPRKEAYLERQLALFGGIDTYCPLMKTPKKHLRKYQRQFEPVFPGYVFVRFEPRTQVFHLRRLHGYHALLQFGGRPATVPEEFIREFRRKECGRGYIVFRPARPLEANEKVRVTAGPFRGQTGVFLRYRRGAERVSLLMDFMNSRRLLELPAEAVEAAAG